MVSSRRGGRDGERRLVREMRLKSVRVTFPGALGHPLAARIEGAGPTARAYAIFAHCFTCSKDLKAVRRISRQLAEHGIGVLRFDFTGLGESQGDFAETNFTSNVEDLVAAADFLRREYSAPELLIGHSLGGAAVLVGAQRIAESKAVVTLGAPSGTRHLRDTLLQSNPELETGEAEVVLAGRTFRLRKQLVQDLEEDRVLSAVSELQRALLIFHSPVDTVVGIDHARRIYQAALHPKSFISLDGADHLLLRDPRDAAYVAEMLAAWASRHVLPGEASSTVSAKVDDGVPLQPGEVSVRGGSSLQVHIQAGRHHLLGDEPTHVGGEDTGPDPYGYLLTSLGACTAMTLRLYANRKGWPLEGVEIRLRHGRVHARDCEECESSSGMIDRIDKTIRFEGDLDASQRDRLMEIADRCPVHRSMTSETVIRSRQL